MVYLQTGIWEILSHL